jgi:hypothetical protein
MPATPRSENYDVENQLVPEQQNVLGEDRQRNAGNEDRQRRWFDGPDDDAEQRNFNAFFGLMWDVWSSFSYCWWILQQPGTLPSSHLVELAVFIFLMYCSSIATDYLFGRVFGSYRNISSSTLKELLWFLSFFVCLATEAEFFQFLEAQCPDNPLPCFSIAVIPIRILTHFLLNGPVSMVLLPLRLISNYKKFQDAQKTRTFGVQLFLLLATDACLYTFCKYRVLRWREKTDGIMLATHTLWFLDGLLTCARCILIWFLCCARWLLIFFCIGTRQLYFIRRCAASCPSWLAFCSATPSIISRSLSEAAFIINNLLQVVSKRW